MSKKRVSVNYRKIYGLKNIPEGWDIHHIDWQYTNNKSENLIAVPKLFHRFIHSVDMLHIMLDYDFMGRKIITDKRTILFLLDIYQKNILLGDSECLDILESEIWKICNEKDKKIPGRKPTKKEQKEIERLMKTFSYTEISNRTIFPDGEIGDQIYRYIFGTNNYD